MYQSTSDTDTSENINNERHSSNQNNLNNNTDDWSTVNSSITTINYNNNNDNNNSNSNKFNGTSTITKNNNNNNNIETSAANKNQIIESLKSKIREYDTQIKNKSKCLICMDEFRDPVVSICCWHVHCEECWLRTLGAVKLCPQCKMITSPTDLRRIYM